MQTHTTADCAYPACCMRRRRASHRMPASVHVRPDRLPDRGTPAPQTALRPLPHASALQCAWGGCWRMVCGSAVASWRRTAVACEMVSAAGGSSQTCTPLLTVQRLRRDRRVLGILFPRDQQPRCRHGTRAQRPAGSCVGLTLRHRHLHAGRGNQEGPGFGACVSRWTLPVPVRARRGILHFQSTPFHASRVRRRPHC